MTPEQIIALISTIIGAPLLIKLGEKWFESKNLRFQTDTAEDRQRDDREWTAMEQALQRERTIYAEFIAGQRQEFAERLTVVEAKLDTIQKEAERYQKLYWEERLQRERLEDKVKYLEHQLSEIGRINNGRDVA
jgi:DNA mismatch repair ATPase MutS